MDTEEIMGLALKLAGFKNAVTEIKIRLGKAENPAGKVVASHCAGTNGAYEHREIEDVADVIYNIYKREGYSIVEAVNAQ